jgi:hypothetical protein
VKTELEVARDAVRSAGLEELADALEWAAAAVRHRATLLSAARWAAGESTERCVDCGHRSVHGRKCPTAEALHALDAQWSCEEVNSAHGGAAHWAPRRLRPMHELGLDYIPPFGPSPLNATEVNIYAMENITAAQAAARSAAELLATADHGRLTYSAPFLGVPVRPTAALLSATLETELPPTPHVWDGQRPVAHADSPTVAQTVSVRSDVPPAEEDERGEWDLNGWQE